MRIRERTLALFDPTQGYRDLAEAFRACPRGVEDAQLFLITAWNPGAVARSSHHNRIAMAELLLFLAQAGVENFPSAGSAGTWYEPGVAFFASDDELALEVARRFGQLGYYRFNRERGYCIDVTGTFSTAALKPF